MLIDDENGHKVVLNCLVAIFVFVMEQVVNLKPGLQINARDAHKISPNIQYYHPWHDHIQQHESNTRLFFTAFFSNF
jgi:hypothetical protein